MMKLRGLVVTAWGLFGDHRSTFGFDVLTFVGVVFFPSSSLVGVVLFPLVLPIDGNGPGNVFGGGDMLRGDIFKSRFLHYTRPLFFSSSASFPLSPSPSFSLFPSPTFYISSSFSFSLSLSLSYGFRLDWVLADVKNGLADCSFLRCRERLC